jgi:hypothetical protein
MARRALIGDGKLRVMFVESSGNTKTGRMPTALVSPNTCPESCPWRAGGCYAEVDRLARWWGKLARGDVGIPWNEFCRRVKALPEGQIWRYATAGDLPGDSEAIDVPKLERLVRANAGKRGLTFTHKPVSDRDNAQAIRYANENGFTINLSADNLHQAALLADMNIAPVTVVVPKSYTGGHTDLGHKVIVCPAQKKDGFTCVDCRLCALPKRKAIIAFQAHGQCSHKVEMGIKQMRLL